jgi:hypothetical protein
MTEMRWFTDAARYADDWETVVRDYARHLDELVPSLSPRLAQFAAEPRFNLHDAEFRRVEIDRSARQVTIVVNAGDLQVGYRELTLRFSDAEVVPDNFQALAYAVGARYHSDHWGDTITIILAQELDRLPDGRFVLRLRLWPFYAFSIEFSDFEMGEAPSGPHTGTPGTLTLR